MKLEVVEDNAQYSHLLFADVLRCRHQDPSTANDGSVFTVGYIHREHDKSEGKMLAARLTGNFGKPSGIETAHVASFCPVSQWEGRLWSDPYSLVYVH